MPTTRRIRKLAVENYGGGLSTLLTKSTGNKTVSKLGPWWTEGDQLTDSEGHDWPPKKGRPVITDLGGDFYTWKRFASDELGNPGSTATSARIDYQDNSIFWEEYWGPVLPVYAIHGNFLPLPQISSNDELDQLGATAIARCKPTNPVADVSVALGELIKEGLPSLPGLGSWAERTRSLKDLKKSGGEYLNIQFGLAPLFSEVNKISKAADKADQLLAQYERDAGKNVRRRYYFPETVEVTQTDANNGIETFPVGPPAKYFIKTQTVKIRTVRTQVWFSGCFSYHLPFGYDSRKKMHEYALLARKVFGVDLNIEVLWNLAPWSWAVDWFTNAGDVISNLASWSSDSLVMRYGYVMETRIITDTYYQPCRYSGSRRGPGATTLSFTTVVKKRRAANPFGFGVSWDGLSPFQLSIIAALGITRGKR